MQQNGVKSLHRNRDPLKQKQRSLKTPGVSTNHQPNSLKNWRASLLIGPWDSTAIGTNSPCDKSPTHLPILSLLLSFFILHYCNIWYCVIVGQFIEQCGFCGSLPLLGGAEFAVTGKWRTKKFQGLENAGLENDGQHCRGWKMQDWKLTDKSAAGQKCGININLQQLQWLALFNH